LGAIALLGSRELAIAKQETRRSRRRWATQLPVKPTTPPRRITALTIATTTPNAG